MVATVGLTDDRLRKLVPAIFATSPEEGVSDRYTFVPTTRVITSLRDRGWYVAKAMQAYSLKDDIRYKKHVVRMRHRDVSEQAKGKVGDLIPELVIYNSHDRTSSYRLYGGIFRMVCSNGMIIADKTFGSINLVHKDYEDSTVMKLSEKFIDEQSNIFEHVGAWQDVKLSRRDKISFATDASRGRWDTPPSEIHDDLLSVRRPEDMNSDLWTVMNVVQENLLKGGFQHPNTNRMVKPIQALDRDREINTHIWDLAYLYSGMSPN